MRFKIGDHIVSTPNLNSGRVSRGTIRVVRGVSGGNYICPILTGDQPSMSIEYIDRHYVRVKSFNDYINEI